MIKQILLSEYEKEDSPSEKEREAFYLGMCRLQDALSKEGTTQERLNESVPDRIALRYISRELQKAMKILEENQQLKKKINSCENTIENIMTLSKKEKEELKKSNAYQQMQQEIEELIRTRDLLIYKLHQKK